MAQVHCTLVEAPLSESLKIDLEETIIGKGLTNIK